MDGRLTDITSWKLGICEDIVILNFFVIAEQHEGRGEICGGFYERTYSTLNIMSPIDAVWSFCSKISQHL